MKFFGGSDIGEHPAVSLHGNILAAGIPGMAKVNRFMAEPELKNIYLMGPILTPVFITPFSNCVFISAFNGNIRQKIS